MDIQINMNTFRYDAFTDEGVHLGTFRHRCQAVSAILRDRRERAA